MGSILGWGRRATQARLTHALDVQRVHDGALVLVARDGPLEGLLLHDLVALLVLHFSILVMGLHLHHLGSRGQREERRGASTLRARPGRGRSREEKTVQALVP